MRTRFDFADFPRRFRRPFFLSAQSSIWQDTYDGQNAASSGYSYVLNGQTAGFVAYTDQFNAGDANNNE